MSVYDTIVKSGSWVLKTFFPDEFQKESLEPDSRYGEYPFAISHFLFFNASTRLYVNIPWFRLFIS